VFCCYNRTKLALAMVVLIGFGTGLCESPCQAAPSEETAEARRTLVGAGLVQEGFWWLTREEVRLRRRLTELSPLLRRLQTARRQLDAALQKNHQVGVQLQRAEAAQKEAQRLLTADTAKGTARRQLEAAEKRASQVVKILQQRFVRTDQLGQSGPVRQSVTELMKIQLVLAGTTDRIRSDVVSVEAQSQQLKRDRDVLRALRTLGPKQRLGPSRNYLKDLVRTADAERRAVADGVPFYREGNRIRLNVRVNESANATFTFSPSGDPTVIPDSLLRGSGLKISPQTPRQRYQRGNRKFDVRVVTIPYLRVGDHTLQDVRALVLPPEGEDLGARISRAAFHDFKVHVDGRRLRIRFEPLAADKKKR
jgi:hypothetical protein